MAVNNNNNANIGDHWLL